MASAPRKATLKRKIRSLGGKVIRRFGLLPGGTPDGIGDDAKLVGQAITGKVIVYFADTPDALYQIEQWYGPFRALDEAYGVTIFCMDSRTAAAIRARSGLTVYTIAQDSTLDDMLLRSDVKLCLYVNHNPLNFLPLRVRSMIHISLLHGDSDKSVSVSNQIKAYDFAFVAGQAGIDRFERYTTLYDAKSRCIAIGYPDHGTQDAATAGPTGSGAGRTNTAATVLYAPTWEGGHPSVAYGSVDTHGPALVQSLLSAGYRVIYRPHPLTGVRMGSYGDADARLRELLAGHADSFVSTDRELGTDFAEADLLIADVSAVANDWLRTGKPLIITRPAGGRAQVATTRMLEVVPRLSDEQAPSVAGVVRSELTDDPTRAQRMELIKYYYGDISPGACERNIVAEAARLIELRDQQWARVQANQGL